MKAIGVEPGLDGPQLLEIPRPVPDPGEVLVRTLRVGIDGTDREVIAGSHGGLPPGGDHLVLGHEAVGVVTDPTTTDFERGDVVAPTVRRPSPDGPTGYFERGEPDMAPPEACLECGIDGADGFMREYFTSRPQYLVPVPKACAEWGFLVEPISITEKALELAYASRSSFEWTPETALVLGNGPLGLLTVGMLVDDFEVYCLGRRDRPDPSIGLVETVGGTYVDARETPLAEVPTAHEPMDLVYEATGYPKHAIQAVDALAPNGVAALLGLPGPHEFPVDGGRFHRELVVKNKAIVGSVNSGRKHFAAAVDRLGSLPDGFLEEYVTEITPLADFEAAFDPDVTMKAAVEFAAP